MSKEIIQFDDAMFESKLDRMVWEKVEQTINLMLDEEADRIPTPPDTREAATGRPSGPATTTAT